MPDSALLGDFAAWYLIFLFSLVLHEASHALVAFWGGDATAYHGGQVTLHPWPHIQREPLGTVIVPIASYFLNGWMIGWASAPYDPRWGRRHPRRRAAMAAAGPAANLLLALATFVVMKALIAGGVLIASDLPDFDDIVQPAAGPGGAAGVKLLSFGLSVALSLNLLLVVFNLLPFPPLDGSGILRGLFPRTLGRPLDVLAEAPWASLLGIILAWKALPYVYWPAFEAMVGLL